MDVVFAIVLALAAYLPALFLTAYVLSRKAGGKIGRRDIGVVFVVWGVHTTIIVAICLVLLA